MTSQLNVDTIVDKAGSGGTNVKIANTSTYVSDAGAATQNTVQGLAKQWAAGDNSSGSTTTDSHNVASLTDAGTGNTTLAFTSNMRAAGAYTVGGTHADASDQEAYAYVTQALQDGSVTTSSIALTHNYAFSNASGNGDYAYWNNTVHGDLA